MAIECDRNVGVAFLKKKSLWVFVCLFFDIGSHSSGQSQIYFTAESDLGCPPPSSGF